MIAVAFTLVGMSINRRFKMRKEAFASLYDFSVKLKGDISYLKTNLPSVIKSHFENNKVAGCTVDAEICRKSVKRIRARDRLF